MISAQVRYWKTPKGKATSARWRNSPKGRAWLKKYNAIRGCKLRRTRYLAIPNRRSYNRTNHLKWNYGLTEKDYKILLESQKGLCGICRMIPGRKKLSIDHNHGTGKVRGLLCNNCNAGIGFLKDDSSLLKRASNYIRRHSR